jgi:hypothetical protein
MVFGIAGGIGIGVAEFRYEKEDFSSFYIAGRHMWQDDAGYLRAAFARFGIEPVVRETSGAKAADKQLREAIADGAPAIAWVDMTHLPHRGLPSQFSGGGYHLVTVYEIDDKAGSAWIGDLTDKPIAISLADLATARGRIKSFKNRLLSIPSVKSSVDTSSLAHAGLKACAGGLRSKPIKGPASMGTLDALPAWAERLYGSADKEGWSRKFPRGHLLWQGLTSVYDLIEYYHTGGGLCRPLYAEFLAEAAELPDWRKLTPLSERYAQIGASWTDLADAAAPEPEPAFREARELCSRRAELFTEGNPDNAVGIRQVWKRLGELKVAARESFPLSERDCAALLKSLQQRVVALHQAEVVAHAALLNAVA